MVWVRSCEGYVTWEEEIQSLEEEQKQAVEQRAKEGLASRLEGNLVHTLPLKPRLFAEGVWGMSTCMTSLWDNVCGWKLQLSAYW